jgi:hypothetical protein
VTRFFDAGQHAHGVIAVGQFATGVVAIGQVAVGVVAIGQVARGAIAIGMASFGIFSVGMASGGLMTTFGLVGIGGRRGGGGVFELLPRLTRQRVLPHASSPADIWQNGEPGWVRATLAADPNGNPALLAGGQPLGIKLLPALRSTADKALQNESTDVLAYTSRTGDVLVAERLMEAAPPKLVERLRYAAWAPRFIGLVLLATAYWILVGFPLVRGLVTLD